MKLLRILLKRARDGGSASGSVEAWLVREAIMLGLVREKTQGICHVTEKGRAWLRRKLSEGGKGGDMPKGAQATAGFNEKESPLVWLSRRKNKDGSPLVTLRQLDAGECLRKDYTFAGLLGAVRSNWRVERVDAGTGGEQEQSRNALDARRRVFQALDSVGPELAGVLVDVCCYLKGLGQVERERLWPERSAKVVLCLGLERLANHYNPPSGEVAERHSRYSKAPACSPMDE